MDSKLIAVSKNGLEYLEYLIDTNKELVLTKNSALPSRVDIVFPLRDDGFRAYRFGGTKGSDQNEIYAFDSDMQIATSLNDDQSTYDIRSFPKHDCMVTIGSDRDFLGYPKLSLYRFVNTRSGRRIKLLNRAAPDYLVGAWETAIEVSSDIESGWISMTSRDGRPVIWKIQGDQLLQIDTTHIENRFIESHRYLTSTDLSIDMRYVAVSGVLSEGKNSFIHRLLVWNLFSGECIVDESSKCEIEYICAKFTSPNQLSIIDDKLIKRITFLPDGGISTVQSDRIGGTGECINAYNINNKLIMLVGRKNGWWKLSFEKNTDT